MASKSRKTGAARPPSKAAKLVRQSEAGSVARVIHDRSPVLRREAKREHGLVDELDEIALRCAALPVQDSRSADEIIGYDRDGLPR